MMSFWGKRREVLKLILGSVLTVGIGLHFVPVSPLSATYSSSVAVYDANHRLLRLTLSADDKYRLWVPLDRISPLLIETTLLQEDKHFYRHFGVNPVALVRAAAQTYLSGGRRIGGSTITMQLARLIYGINSRSIPGKLTQIARALQLELLHSKDELLEAYLNLVPYGRNVEGVAAASLIYFGKMADRLTLSEAMMLAVIPQSPAHRAPGTDGGKFLMASRDRLIEKWLAMHRQAKEDGSLIRLQPRMRDIANLPFHAPHFVDAILATRPKDTEIASTLDLPLQRLVERHTRAYVARQNRIGINNVSAMLIDYTTMEVKAMLGSADFFNDDIQGQVNGTLAKRSPGSILKPTLYALGLDQGVIHPMTVLKDSPIAFGTFNPENFDGQFIGPISAKDALIRSRNVPAVSIAAKLSNPSFYQFLKTAGISHLRSEEHYGLTLVLGGGEVTMEEVVSLYAALANEGVLKPLRYRTNDPAQHGVRILSEEASYLTLDMLKDNPRPDQTYSSDWVKGALPVYWKTGTSFGFRDAWSVGIFGRYVLAVWIGNFNGEGNPAFVGVQAAAPLFFQIVDSIRAQQKDFAMPIWSVPADIAQIEVCAVSGQLPGAYCRQRKLTWFIPGKSPIQICNIHREVVIDQRTGLEACPPYKGATRTEIFEFWPSDMLKIFQMAGIPRRVPPPSGAECSLTVKSMRGDPPRIKSPIQGLTYVLRTDKADRESIPFQAITDADVREVFWFVNEGFVGKAHSGNVFMWTATPGSYVVRAVDDRGRADSRNLHVTVVQ